MESIALKILNIGAFSELEKENECLLDVEEKEIRNQLLEAIMDKITDYDNHIFEYKYNEHVKGLKKRGIEFIPVENAFVVAQWDELFASLVSEEAKKKTKHYSDQFKWHLFSFELLQAKKVSDARKYFDSQEKSTLYLFFQYTEEAYLVKNANLLKAEDFDVLGELSTLEKSDIYVFDPLEKWTYVKTHEESCGPYFFRANLV